MSSMFHGSEGCSSHQLVLSINTVKKHLANLYDKFNMRSRAQAIVQAH